MGGRKRPAAARISRSKKKYWRKGADVTEIEEGLLRSQNANERRSVANLSDDQLFEIDSADSEEKKKSFTRKQRATLDKISFLINREHVTELPSGLEKQIKLEKLPLPKIKVLKSEKKKVPDHFDLWNSSVKSPLGNVPEAAKEGAEFYLRQTKKIISKVPNTMRNKPSLLKPVEIPGPATSYNPELEEYLMHLKDIADDETLKLAKEKKLNSSVIAAYVNPDIAAEENRIDENSTDEQNLEAGAINARLPEPVTAKPKTKKQRRKQKELQEKAMKQLKQQTAAVKENEVFKSKKITKTIVEQQKETERKRKLRAEKKAFDSMTKRQKLGAGKYEEPEAPFLLTEELTDTMRQLKPQGNLLTDRMKSLQKRNVLPIAGERSKQKKQKLRFKKKDRRTHSEIDESTGNPCGRD